MACTTYHDIVVQEPQLSIANMSPPSNHKKALGAVDTSLGRQASVITLKQIDKLTLREIEAKTGVPKSTAGDILKRARARLTNDDSNKENLPELLDSIPAQSARPGKRPRVAEGSELSKKMRKAMVTNPNDSREEAVKEVLKEAGITKLARHQVDNVAMQHRDPDHNYTIVRAV